MEIRETIRFTVMGIIPPSVSSCVTVPVMTKFVALLEESSDVAAFNVERLETVLSREGALTTAQIVRSPAVAGTRTEEASTLR